MESGIDEIAIMSLRPHGHISVVFSSAIPILVASLYNVVDSFMICDYRLPMPMSFYLREAACVAFFKYITTLPGF